GNEILFYGYNDADNETNNARTRAITSQSSGLCIGYWNREHVFAKSLANPSLVTDEPGPGTDVHNLRAADCQMNSRRNNNYFRDGSGNSFLDGEFYPGDEFKGDVARIIMYMYLRYPSQCEPSNIGVGSASYSNYGDMPNLFLDWNEEDPVSDFERDRNDVIYSYQGNRNPFIDNPYLALKIWNGPDLVDSWGVLSSPNLAFQRLSVYPTITNDYLYIQGTGVVRNSIEIFNQLGQALEFELDENKIDVTSFSNGLYIMNINHSNQSKLFKFLVY
ncbi:MAG: endonuclease, partial [Flavobacteriaceae bacterium]